MGHYRVLIERLDHSDKAFKLAWKEYARTGIKSHEPENVKSSRDRFRVSYNLLFDELISLKPRLLAGESTAIDLIIEFLEVDIPACGCGYAKQTYLRKLKSLRLNQQQKLRLSELALVNCNGPRYGPELADVSRLMIKIADADFIRELRALLNSPKSIVRLKAERMLNLVLRHRQDLACDPETSLT